MIAKGDRVQLIRPAPTRREEEAMMERDATVIYDAIDIERIRQERLREQGKFLYTCASADFRAFPHAARVTVLGEEFGEVCRAALGVEHLDEGRYDRAAALVKLRAELVQVAAVAVAYLEALRVVDEGHQRRSPTTPAAQDPHPSGASSPLSAGHPNIFASPPGLPQAIGP